MFFSFTSFLSCFLICFVKGCRSKGNEKKTPELRLFFVVHVEVKVRQSQCFKDMETPKNSAAWAFGSR